MRNKKLLFLFTLLIGLSAIIFTKTSCKKIEPNAPKIDVVEKENVVEKFFKNSETLNSTYQRIITDLKQKQQKDSTIIPSIVKNCGYPVWDKCTYVVDFKTSKTSDNNADTIIKIPLVLPSTVSVNSFIESHVTETVSSTLYQSQQYASLPKTLSDTTQLTAEKYAIQFMILENRVFGHHQYFITDSTLFRSPKT